MEKKVFENNLNTFGFKNQNPKLLPYPIILQVFSYYKALFVWGGGGMCNYFKVSHSLTKPVDM